MNGSSNPETEVDPALVRWLAYQLRGGVTREEINEKAAGRFRQMTGKVLDETWEKAEEATKPGFVF